MTCAPKTISKKYKLSVHQLQKKKKNDRTVQYTIWFQILFNIGILV